MILIYMEIFDNSDLSFQLNIHLSLESDLKCCFF